MSEKKGTIKSVAKAISIIMLLVHNRKPMSLSSIASELGMAKSTAHGLISTLLDEGCISQNQDTGFYELGNKMYEIGASVTMYWDEKTIAKPYILKLVEKYQETVHLAKLSDGQVLYIDKQESTQSAYIVSEMGFKLPAHCTGLGKVLLSGLSNNEIRLIIKRQPLVPYTENTIVDIEDLIIEIEGVRRNRYSRDAQEFVDGVSCIAVPIYNHQNKITASLSVSFSMARADKTFIEQVKSDLLSISHDISTKLGSTYFSE